MKLRVRFLVILIPFALLSMSAPARPSSGDLLLSILQEEVDRQFRAFPRIVNPVYFLSYRVEEINDCILAASMGSRTQFQNRTERILTIQIRVGSNKLDNFHLMRKSAPDRSFLSKTIRLPLDDNEEAIHQILTRETKEAYFNAVRQYRQVLTNAAIMVREQDTADDYTLLPATYYYEPPASAGDLDFEAWQQKLNACTAEFVDEETAVNGSATLHYRLVRKYFVSSEGTSIVENHPYTYFSLTATTQADDGMILPLHKNIFRQYPDELPPVEQLVEEASSMKMQLSALKTAAVADAFIGPAVLSNVAAAALFHEIVGHGVEAGNFKHEINDRTLKNKIGEHIMSEDFSIIFDPTVTIYNEAPLSGSYHYDDEGVAGRRVTAVDHGILNDFLLSRTPIENFYVPDGHGRAEHSRQPLTCQSNLFVSSEHPYSDAELRQMLRQEAKRQGKAYGYWIQSVEDSCTMSCRQYPNFFNIRVLSAYRVYADERPDELVRGIDIVGTPLSILSQIMAGGNLTEGIAVSCNSGSGHVPAHCCAPAIFIRMLETQKQIENQDRPPLLPHHVSDRTVQIDNFPELALKAMKDEISENMATLKLDRMLPPYYISCLVTDARIAAVTGIMGSVVTSEERSSRDFETRVLVGNDRVNNEHYIDENSLLSVRTPALPLPLDNDYQNIRRSLRHAVDYGYREAAARYAGKQDVLKLQNLPEDVLSLDDRSEAKCENYFHDRYYESLSLSYLQDVVCELSQMFTDADSLTDSGVDIYAYRANALFSASDGVQYAQPFSFICLRIHAATVAEDGEPLMDCTNLFYKDIENMPAAAVLKNHVVQMIERMRTIRHAPKIANSYAGPVLVTGDAAAQWFGHAFLESPLNIVASRQPICSNPDFLQSYRRHVPADNPLAQQIDRQILDNHLTVTALDGTEQFDGLELIGSYRVDAEGVSVDESRNYIESGVLLSLLSNRTPTHNIHYSNGHERLALTGDRLTTSRGAGVLSLSGNMEMSEDKLKRKLLRLANAKGYKYAYVIRKMADRNMCDVPNAKVYCHNRCCRPVYLYRIDVATGRETMVRTAVVEELNLLTFNKLCAASGTKFACNTLMKGQTGSCVNGMIPFSGIPCSLIVPTALLFNEIKIYPLTGTPLEPELRK